MLQGKVKAIFFDLDRTLWDFEQNASETLVELFHEFNFGKLTDSLPSDFVQSFRKHSQALWSLYDQRLIDKQTLRERRFRLAMDDLDIAPEYRPDSMWNHFLAQCPTRTNLMPGAREILESLSKNYPLYIITNGFMEVQRKKLEYAGLSSYFKDVIISEEVGYKKPEKEIFELSLNRAGLRNSQAIMIGDSLELDVMGALGAGWEAVWFNPHKIDSAMKPQVNEITDLSELRTLLL